MTADFADHAEVHLRKRVNIRRLLRQEPESSTAFRSAGQGHQGPINSRAWARSKVTLSGQRVHQQDKPVAPLPRGQAELVATR